MKKRLPEYFDQFLLIGVVAGTGEVVITFPDGGNPVLNLAIRISMTDLLKTHGTPRQ